METLTSVSIAVFSMSFSTYSLLFLRILCFLYEFLAVFELYVVYKSSDVSRRVFLFAYQ